MRGVRDVSDCTLRTRIGMTLQTVDSVLVGALLPPVAAHARHAGHTGHAGREALGELDTRRRRARASRRRSI